MLSCFAASQGQGDIAAGNGVGFFVEENLCRWLQSTVSVCYNFHIVCEDRTHSRYYKEVCYMASVCEVCGKGELSGNNVSHSHLKTKRTWKPNIQRVRAVVEGEVKRVNVCTRCLRSGKVERAI